ncbi:hypothetical protein [Streptomyces sp. NPDC060031]|uniref:hypothetical protein n=1 Tax=Streptomyces sp. NPDC060031 TaxID=3347043 RepID=UPI00369C4CA9
MALRDNQVSGVNTAAAPTTYAIRIGGNAANVSCQGNTVRKAAGSATAVLDNATNTTAAGNAL